MNVPNSLPTNDGLVQSQSLRMLSRTLCLVSKAKAN